MKRLLAIAFCIVGLAAAAAPTALADPINGGMSAELHFVCEGRNVTVVVFGSGEFTPALDTASTSVFIPVAFDVTFTFTPTGGLPQPRQDTSTKPSRIKNLTTCAIPLQTFITTPDGVVTTEGTVTGFWTPR